MWKESKMDITAVNYNSNGSVDRGLFQLNSGTVIELAKEAGIANFDTKDPYMNIDVGVYYLSIMRDNFAKDFSDEDTFNATCFAFNRGGNATRRLIRREGFSVVANSAYAQKISEYKQQLETTGTFIDYVKEK
jgi:soluble lytic murein transglycosylase-like protein